MQDRRVSTGRLATLIIATNAAFPGLSRFGGLVHCGKYTVTELLY